jgi:hypothetical protein
MTEEYHFRFDQLSHFIVTQILEYLPISHLYTLEQTCKDIRNHVAANSFLKYYCKNGLTHRNPKLNGFYTVHHAWSQICYLIGMSPLNRYIRVYEPDGSQPCEIPISLLIQSAVFPPLKNLTLRLNHNFGELDKGFPEKCFQVVGSGQGGCVTFFDILDAICKFRPLLREPDYFSKELEMGKVGHFLEDLEWIEGTEFAVLYWISVFDVCEFYLCR